MRVGLVLNGSRVDMEIDARTTLQELLHDRLGCAEVKRGCGEGVCGSCVVLRDGAPVASCLLLAAQCGEQQIRTASGLARGDDEVAQTFSHVTAELARRGAFQCGYCAPGMVVTATDLVLRRRRGETRSVREGLAGHLCRCTGYAAIVEGIEAGGERVGGAGAESGERVGGAEAESGERKAGVKRQLERIEGRARYVTDVAGEAPLVAKIAWSDRAAARIVGVDVTAARAVAGVRAVLTYEDVPGKNVVTGLFAADQPLLAVDRVRSRGDAIAMVIAESEAAAREAVGRIAVDYEDEPASFDPWEVAFGEDDATRVRDTLALFTEGTGDYDAAIETADVVVTGTYTTTSNDHVCLELEGGMGRWEGGDLVLVGPTLTPHAARQAAAAAIGVGEERVRIESPLIGGSFGKYLMVGLEPYVALAAHHARGAVRLVLDRPELLARRPKRHALVTRYTLGIRNDGTFVALKADLVCDAGPYATITPSVVSVFAAEVAGAYTFPHLQAAAWGVRTNNLLGAPMRGFGSQQVSFGIESIVEKASRAIGKDPAEVRRRNARGATTDVHGRDVSNRTDVVDTIDKVTAGLGPRPNASRAGLIAPWRLGRGVATIRCKYGYPYGMVDRFAVRIAVETDGRFYLESDVADSGTGIVETAAGIVSRELGLAEAPEPRLSAALADPTGVSLSGRAPGAEERALYAAFERLQVWQAVVSLAVLVRLSPRGAVRLVKVVARPLNWMNAALNWVKSKVFPRSIDSYIPRTSGSRGMPTVGRAAEAAATAFRSIAMDLATQKLGVSAAGLAWTPEGIATRDAPVRRVGWGELAHRAGGTLYAVGTSDNPKGWLLDAATGNQAGAIDHMLASHGVDLAVHPWTGEVRLLKYVACHDVGHAIDPDVVRGQIAGSIAMGIGQALYEDVDLQAGIVGSTSLRRYHVPSARELPTPAIELLESGTGWGPRGAKGVGEAAAVAAPIAIVHALYDALGEQPESLPVTAEMIVQLAAD